MVSPVPVEELAAESQNHEEQLLPVEVVQDKLQQAQLLRHEVGLEAVEVLVEVDVDVKGAPLRSRLEGLLQAVPLRDGAEDGQLSPKLVAFGEILREFVILDLYCQSLAFCCQAAIGSAKDGPVEALTKGFSDPRHVDILRRLIDDFY